jgi:hypothetical protein
MKTNHFALVTAWACAIALLCPPPAAAQAARSGPTFSLGGTTSPVILPDIAHDYLNNRWLQVAGNGFIEGHLMNSTGGLIATMHVNATSGYVQNPRVEFSPDVAGGAGGYLVTWHETLGNLAYVRGRLVGADGVPIGSDIAIGPGGSSWLAGAAIAYSTGSHEFLVAWVGSFGITDDIHAQRLSAAGGLLGGLTLISSGSGDWDREPSIAYNPHTDQFYIAYASYSRSNYGYVSGRLMQAGTGVLGGIQLLATNLASRIPSVTYNTETRQYLVVWHHSYSGGAAFYGQVLNGADVALVGGLKVISSYFVAYDALDVDYNAPSGEFLLVTHGRNWEDAGVSIKGTGDPFDNGFQLTNTTDVRAVRPNGSDGNFNPRVAASRLDKRWLMVTSSVFAATHGQFAVTSGSGGGGSPAPAPVPAPAPAPPPAASAPRMAIDLPRTGSTITGGFQIAGWALDLGAPSGPGVDAIHVWAFPASGAAAVLVGTATPGDARPDLVAAFGSARFLSGGYSLNGALQPGNYTLVVYAHSTVTGTFNNSAAVNITVLPPRSLPRMSVDMPGASQTLSRNFRVSGWALDLAASSGTGIDAVDVWAFPVSGAAPQFVGSATIGGFRPDVGAAFGASRFSAGGFNLDVSGTLAPGDYTLMVYARTNLLGVFNNWVAIRIRVV